MALRLQESLLRCGGVLIVWNRTREKALAVESAGARVAASFEEVVKESETLCLMVLGDDAVGELIQKLVEVVRMGLSVLRTVICLSTISPGCATTAATACMSVNVDFVCAPVTGRPDAVERGALLVWLSSARATPVDSAISLLQPLARHVEVLSTTRVDAAARFKLCTNFLVYGGVQLLAEATSLAKRCDAGPKAIATWCQFMCPNTFLAGYSTKIRDSDFYGSEAGAPLSVGSKDLHLIWEMLLSTSAEDGKTAHDFKQAMPTLAATMKNIARALDSIDDSETRGRVEWCIFSNEVARQLNS